MNKLDQKVLQILKCLTKEGDYAMVDFAEIAGDLPEFKANPLKIKDAVDRLEYKGYVKVKYIDVKECCLTVTPQSRSAKRTSAYGAERLGAQIYPYFVLPALGSILGCIIYALIFARLFV